MAYLDFSDAPVAKTSTQAVYLGFGTNGSELRLNGTDFTYDATTGYLKTGTIVWAERWNPAKNGQPAVLQQRIDFPSPIDATAFFQHANQLQLVHSILAGWGIRFSVAQPLTGQTATQATYKDYLSSDIVRVVGTGFQPDTNLGTVTGIQVIGAGGVVTQSRSGLAIPRYVVDIALRGDSDTMQFLQKDGVTVTQLIADAQTLHGGLANDTLIGVVETSDSAIGDMVTYFAANGAVTVDLAAGTATGSGTDTLVDIENVDGSNFADRITGDGGRNTLYGSSGNDTLHGGGGSDQLSGDSGDDVVYGDEGDDLFEAHTGNDIYDGGPGLDIVFYGNPASPPFGDTTGKAGVTITLGATTAQALGNFFSSTSSSNHTLVSIEGVVGSAYNDTLTGSDVDNVIAGLWGNDSIRGGMGSDSLDGGPNNDTIYGDEGNDAIDCGDGDDYAIGGQGSDLILGGNGRDYLLGSEGTDLLVGGAGADTLDGGVGLDRVDYQNPVTLIVDGAGLAAAGSSGDAVGDVLISIEHIVGSTGNDSISVGNTIGIVYGNGGNDTLTGGTGTNQLNGDGGNDIIHGGGASGELMTGDVGVRTMEVLAGGDGNDLIYVETLVDQIAAAFGDAGNDTILGGAGGDGITGGSGDDSLVGNAGNDVLTGGDGADTIEGGDGLDTIFSDGGNDDIRGGNDLDVIFAGNGADTVDGGDGSDLMFDDDGMSGDVYIGGAGNDGIKYRAGSYFDFSSQMADRYDDTIDYVLFEEAVTVLGSAGVDRYNGYASNADNFSGMAGNDWLIGWGGNDLLLGGEDNDRIDGGYGADTIDGGAGNDVLTGGNPATTGGDGASDIFRFGDGWGYDHIFDFEAGLDRIEFDRVTGLTELSQLQITQVGGDAQVAFGLYFFVVHDVQVNQLNASNISIVAPPLG